MGGLILFLGIIFCCHVSVVWAAGGAASLRTSPALLSLQRNNRNNHIIKPKENAAIVAVMSENEFKKTGKKGSRILPWIPDGMKNAMASYLATVLVKVLLQPFDTIKTIQQIQTVPQGVFATGARLVRARGIAGLWSGTLVSAFGASPSVAVYFGVFSSAKKRLTALMPFEYRFLAISLAAAIGNTVAAVLRVPYEVFKQRLQAGMHKTLLETVTYTVKIEGVYGLFGGGKLISQIIRDVPYAIFVAVAYDLLQLYVFEATVAGRRTSSSGSGSSNSGSSSKSKSRFQLSRQMRDAISGATAGGISTFLTTPMDVIKTRLMAGAHSYVSVSDAVRQMVRDEGFLTFFAGCQSRLYHKIPANGLFFLFYEVFRYALGAVDSRSEQ